MNFTVLCGALWVWFGFVCVSGFFVFFSSQKKVLNELGLVSSHLAVLVSLGSFIKIAVGCSVSQCAGEVIAAVCASPLISR